MVVPVSASAPADGVMDRSMVAVGCWPVRVNVPAVGTTAPAVETVASPVNVTSYYAPAPVAVTSYYAPAPAYAAPVYAAPVTSYYAPAAVAVPVYRRGLFGGLRPTRTAMYIPY